MSHGHGHCCCADACPPIANTAYTMRASYGGGVVAEESNHPHWSLHYYVLRLHQFGTTPLNCTDNLTADELTLYQQLATMGTGVDYDNASYILVVDSVDGSTNRTLKRASWSSIAGPDITIVVSNTIYSGRRRILSAVFTYGSATVTFTYDAGSDTLLYVPSPGQCFCYVGIDYLEAFVTTILLPDTTDLGTLQATMTFSNWTGLSWCGSYTKAIDGDGHSLTAVDGLYIGTYTFNFNLSPIVLPNVIYGTFVAGSYYPHQVKNQRVNGAATGLCSTSNPYASGYNPAAYGQLNYAAAPGDVGVNNYCQHDPTMQRDISSGTFNTGHFTTDYLSGGGGSPYCDCSAVTFDLLTVA